MEGRVKGDCEMVARYIVMEGDGGLNGHPRSQQQG